MPAPRITPAELNRKLADLSVPESELAMYFVADDEQLERFKDKPVVVQYFRWLNLISPIGFEVTNVVGGIRWNPRFGGRSSLDDFVGYMSNLGLPHPKQMAIAVPATPVSAK